MQRFVLLLLGMASLVASGVIMDRGRVTLNTMGGLGLQTVQGTTGGIGADNVLNKNDLLRQKFILDILHQVYMPLQQQDLLMLDDRNIITNENLYMRPLTQEMQMVLDLIQNNQMLSKQTIASISNQHHVQQAVGLHRLFVAARDFETLKHLAVYARKNINTEMFVHSLVVALGERQDTQKLVVPAVHEIVPQLYIKNHVIDQVRQLDTGVSSIRPQLMDIMGMGHRNYLLNSRIADQQQQQGGLLGVLNKSQLRMPWRQLHKQMALQRMIGGNIVQQDSAQTDKLVISLPSNGLLSQDISLKSYITMMIDEVLLNQDTTKNTNKNYIGSGGDINENIKFGKRGQSSYYGDIVNGGRRNRADNDFNGNDQYEGIYGNNYGGVRQGIDADMEMNRNRGIYGTGKYGQDIYDIGMDKKTYGNIEDYNDASVGGRGYNTRYNIDEEDVYMGRNNNMQQGQQGVNTVSDNEARLLFVGRRRKNPHSVVNMGSNRYDEDDLISGGRRVANQRSNYEQQRNKYNNANDDDDDYYKTMNIEKYINANGQGLMGYNTKDDFDDLLWNKNRGSNYYDSRQNQQNYGNYKRNYGGKGVGIGMNTNREDFLNLMTRDNGVGQKQYYEQDFMYNSGYTGESLDSQLPTTNVNDERLLHINRHKLNNGVQGVYVNSNEDYQNAYDRYNTDAYDRYNTDAYDRYNTDAYDNYNNGYQGGNINGQQSYYDEQTKYDTTRHGNQNSHSGARNNYNNGEKHGHRHRRSVVNQDQDFGQKNTINGKLVLHALQQIVARLNIERIALGQPQLIENTHTDIGYGVATHNLKATAAINGVDVQTINEIEAITQQIDNALQQTIGQISVATYNQKINEIGLILAGQIQGLGLTDMLGDILQQTNPQQRKGLVTNLLENEAAQLLLAGIVKVVDEKVQQVFRQRDEFISNVQGVNINNVEVDKLQTYVDHKDIDLTNLLTNNEQQTTQGNNKVVVGRIPRLNHKSFNIKIDVSSDRQQQVVVRNLLVPKVDGQNNILPPRERRQNVVVLDITTVELQQGQNSLKLKSTDITITSPETTPITKIYQLVMQGLNGNIILQQDALNGQSTLLPHHLLLPRGRTNGLPMQLITVVTPLKGSSGNMEGQTGNPLNTLLLDHLPLNYPLHCDITDLDKVISMPNLMVKDVKIYHDENIQMNLVY